VHPLFFASIVGGFRIKFAFDYSPVGAGLASEPYFSPSLPKSALVKTWFALAGLSVDDCPRWETG
jgi:hypothetical protein